MNTETITSRLCNIVDDYAERASAIYGQAINDAKASIRSGEVMPSSFPVNSLPCSEVIRQMRGEADAKIALLREDVQSYVMGSMVAALSEQDARTLDVLLSRNKVSQEEIDAYALKYRNSYPFMAGLREVASKCGVNPPAPHDSERTMNVFDVAAKRAKAIIWADSTLTGGGDAAFLKADVTNILNGQQSFMGKSVGRL